MRWGLARSVQLQDQIEEFLTEALELEPTGQR
jgi:hypothetical protein